MEARPQSCYNDPNPFADVNFMRLSPFWGVTKKGACHKSGREGHYARECHGHERHSRQTYQSARAYERQMINTIQNSEAKEEDTKAPLKVSKLFEAAMLGMEEHNEDTNCYFDSGATKHMTRDANSELLGNPTFS